MPVDFVLFALTLLGVALFHRHTLPVALTGLAAIIVYKLAFTGFKFGAGLGGFGQHMAHEWVMLTNLFLLLMGFALLSRHFEESRIPDEMPALLPDDWKGGVALLFLVFVLSSFLDNIAAALIGGTVARHVFQGKVHIGYLAAIVAASNAGGSGSVVGDTTTTMMWIAGVSPLSVLEAYVAAIVAMLVFAVPASLQQQRFSPILKKPPTGLKIDPARVFIVAAILVAALAANVIANLKFPAVLDTIPVIGLAVWAIILLTAGLRAPDWSVMPETFKGTIFLLALVTAASLMPVEKLPAASWQTALGLGFVSAVFDNIPLTALALKQGGYDWGYLAYAVGFGGSMIWFGSSAGVALSNMYPQAKSVGLWLKHGWHVALAYVIGFFVLYAVLGWHPNAPHKAKPAAALQTPGAAVYGMTGLPCGWLQDGSRIPAPSRMSVQGFTLPIIPIQTEETTNEQSATVAPQIPDRRGRGRRGNARLPGDRQGAGPDLDALAEHLALEGHLPRVRARLRQESERHDRRRSQDRGAARRRRGACIRPARRGLQGNARRRPRRAGLPLRQAECAGAVGIEPRVRHGRQHFACLAQIRWRQGAAQQALQLDRRERGVVPVRTDADAAAWLVQEADYQARRLQGPQVPHSGHLDRPVPGHGRGGERAAGQRDRAGDRPRQIGRAHV